MNLPTECKMKTNKQTTECDMKTKITFSRTHTGISRLVPVRHTQARLYCYRGMGSQLSAHLDVGV
jgi:hypothetical protein